MKMSPLCLALLFASAASIAADEAPFALNGQIDAQYRWNSKPQLTKGFALQDAALYISHTSGPASIFVDLPFSKSADDNADFAFATGKAQAYITYKTEGPWTFKAGQFDGIFGYEPGDSKDRFHTDTGLVAALLPGNHVGLLTSYDIMPDTTLSFLIANPRNQGGIISTGTETQNLDYAIQAGMLLGFVNISAGGLIHKISDEYFKEFNLLLGIKFNQFDLNLEGDLVQSDIPNEFDKGIGMYLTHQHTEKLTGGLRVEYVKGPILGDSIMATVGPSYQLTSKFKIHGDVSIHGDGNGGNKNYNGNISGVYSF